MRFDPEIYGAPVARILALDGDGHRPMPLAITGPVCPEATRELRGISANELFPDARAPRAALSGLWLYFSCFEEAHSIAQDIEDADGSYWHGILHRQEPDAGNAAYWFRQVGQHPVFPPLLAEASAILQESPVQFRVLSEWDPFRFIDFCETARQRAGSTEEKIARAIQLKEWQLLFDHCARRGS